LKEKMTNFLSELPKIVVRKKKRLGRGLGSGKGAKSGRGTTRHQKARESIPLHFEGGQARMVKKFPLLRGKGHNKSFQQSPVILSLNHLNRFDDNAVVTIESLVKKNIIGDKIKKVKVLNRGQLEKKLIIRLPVSARVKKAIEKLGGQVSLSEK